MTVGLRLLAIFTVCVLASCSNPPVSNGNKAQVLADIENRVAVAKIGTKVCRDFRVGVSERNWVKGTVVAMDGDDIVVAVEDPGRILMDVQGIRLEKGIRLTDAPLAWTPCL